MSKSNKIDFQVCLITNRKYCKGRDLLFCLQEALEGGIRCIQLREKDLDTKSLLEMAIEIRKLTQDFSAKLIINDRIDICLAVDADGVHLPENGIPIEAARILLGKNKIIGVSSHSMEGLLDKSNKDIDFVSLSPIFKTLSKPVGTKTLSLEALTEAKRLSKIPLFALGGIDESNALKVIKAGSDGIALISGILSKKDIRSAAINILNKFKI
jgi:thiamine-phosphate pyrophosphorylase